MTITEHLKKSPFIVKLEIYQNDLSVARNFQRNFKLHVMLVASENEEINPLNAELNPVCYLLALLAHHFLHVSRIKVKSLTLRLLMSYIYIYTYIYIWSAYS